MNCEMRACDECRDSKNTAGANQLSGAIACAASQQIEDWSHPTPESGLGQDSRNRVGAYGDMPEQRSLSPSMTSGAVASRKLRRVRFMLDMMIGRDEHDARFWVGLGMTRSAQ